MKWISSVYQMDLSGISSVFVIFVYILIHKVGHGRIAILLVAVYNPADLFKQVTDRFMVSYAGH
jgi:hypothetical protein